MVAPLLEAGDVALRSLQTPLDSACTLLRTRRRHGSAVGRDVDWNVVNLVLADGRSLRYRVTDNVDAHGPGGPGSPPIWAVNLHGYFAGGSMYARESKLLAERFGWRIVNPSLPGFGGSDPFRWSDISMDHLADQITTVLDDLDVGPVLLLGHSMGGAVAMRFTARHPESVIGIIYRDGVATPRWQQRGGIVARLLASTLPDIAPVADMMAAVALDLPDLLAGHALATIRAMIPDLRHNVRTIARSAPVASMLMSLDLSEDVRLVRKEGVPILAEWGCFDRLIPPSTGAEFAEVADVDVHWVPGGHSWMLARPSGQADVLSRVPWGQAFLETINERAVELSV